MPRQISKSSAASRNDIQTRPTSSKRIENTRGANVAQPANKIKPRNQLTTALLNVERTWQRHPIQASVKLIKHGEMASYGHEARLLAVDYSPSPPTLELSLRDGKLYVELFAFQSGTSKSPGTTPVKLATFHYVADGRYQLSTNVFRIGKRIVIYKYDKQAKTDKGHKWFSFQLAAENDAQAQQTNTLWRTMTHHLQSMSISELDYLNMPRAAALTTTVAHRYNTRAAARALERIEQSAETTPKILSYRVPGKDEPWDFPGRYSLPEILQLREEMKSGMQNHQVDETPTKKQASRRKNKKTAVARRPKRQAAARSGNTAE